MNRVSTTIISAGNILSNTVGRLAGGAMRFATRASYGFGFLLGRTRINYRSEVGDPTKNSAVVAVVGWIARNFPEAPVRVRKILPDGGHEAIISGDTGPGYMLKLLERPNRYFSGVLMWMATITDIYCTGNGYWIKVRGAADRVIELWWVPAALMRPVWPDDGSVFIAGYYYRLDGKDYFIEERDVVHFRDGIDPENPRLGLSKLASLFREIYTDDEAGNFTAVLLTNLGVPGVVIAPSNTGGLGQKTDPETVKTQFMDKFGGDRRGEPLVLTSPTDVKVLSFNPEQMQLRELRRIPEERISAVTGIPASVAGLGAGLDQNAFTSYGEARKAAYQEAVIPLQRVIAAELEVQLLPDFYDEEVFGFPLDVDFDTSKASALQEALDGIWKRAESAATRGLITRAAFKQMTGQPVQDGDDVYILPSNYLVLPVGAKPPKPSQAGGSFPPAGAPQGLLEAPPVVALLEAGGAIRCSSCDKLLAEQATAPYRLSCPRCKTVTESSAAA